MTAQRSALVVGAGGFVGRSLVAELREHGWRAVSLVRPSRDVDRADPGSSDETRHLNDVLELPEILDTANVDTVFHLAAHQSRGHSPTDIDAFVESNLRLGMHLFDAAARRRISVVNALSYFQFRDGAPAAHSLYSATKQAQAEFARYWRDCLGADIRDVVLFDNFGPGDTRDKLVPHLVSAARSGATLAIGPLEQRIDLLHVRDVARGLIAAAEGSYEDTLSVRANNLVTVGEVVELVSVAAGTRVPVSVDPDRVLSEAPARAGNWPRPRGWNPRVALPEGIAEVVASRA